MIQVNIEGQLSTLLTEDLIPLIKNVIYVFELAEALPEDQITSRGYNLNKIKAEKDDFKLLLRRLSDRMMDHLDADITKAEDWDRYYEEIKYWQLRYKENLTSMEAAMSKPNKPGYYRANND